jgi:hypothetical protein
MTELAVAARWAAEKDYFEALFYGTKLGPSDHGASLVLEPGRFSPGLVPIPTRGPRLAGPAFTPVAVRDETTHAQRMTDTFSPDPVQGRIARLRRTIGAAARCHEAVKVEDANTVMVTLTYRGTNADWQPGHIRDFLKIVRKHLARRGLDCRYVWVAELQKRGVIHYHVVLWLPPGVHLPMPDQCGWWPHGFSRIEVARKAVPYLMHYLKKCNDALRGSLPEGARCHGRGGLGEQFREVLRWLALPAFIKARASVSERWRRAVGGGWHAPDGTHWASEFCRVWVGEWALKRIHDHGRPFEVDGAFSRYTPGSDGASASGLNPAPI